jgi:peptidoglycan L-alanyl-D-glutamate endopeptidase CwlK
MDERSEKNLAKLHPKVQQRFRDFLIEAQSIAAELGVEYRAISSLRTFAEQDALYAQGRTNKSLPRVTNAKAGQSYHNYGLAIDCGVFRGKTYLDGVEPKTADIVHRRVGAIAEKHGLTWGGTFKGLYDAPHFEFSKGLPIATLLERHNKNQELL